MDNIIFHADDYGATAHISEDILECIQKGRCRSISILPQIIQSENAGYIDKLAPYKDNIRISIHLNIAEGHCLSKASGVSLLVDERGMFNTSFFKILMWSYSAKRNELKRQLKSEIGAQIDALKGVSVPLCIDSHQHYHMIPLFLETVLECIGERGLKLEFIRVPAESLLPLLKNIDLIFTIRPINLVKNFVLNILYILDKKMLQPYQDKTAVFFGIMLSGKMDKQRVFRLLPEFEKIAQRRRLGLEVLAHPGGEKDINRLMDSGNSDCALFYADSGRAVEKEMMLSL